MRHRLFLLLIVLSLFLVSCGYSESDLQAAREEGYREGYWDGCDDVIEEYEDSFSIGYGEVDSESRYALERYLMDEFYMLEYETSFEEAVNTIQYYFDCPGEVSDSDGWDAAMTIYHCYYELLDIIESIH